VGVASVKMIADGEEFMGEGTCVGVDATVFSNSNLGFRNASSSVSFSCRMSIILVVRVGEDTKKAALSFLIDLRLRSGCGHL